jgi:hypothetical protein
MKATLKFDLNDPDQRMAHFRAIKSLDMAIALFDININLYKRAMYIIEDSNKNLSTGDAIDLIFEEINKIMAEQQLNMDELID